MSAGGIRSETSYCVNGVIDLGKLGRSVRLLLKGRELGLLIPYPMFDIGSQPTDVPTDCRGPGVSVFEIPARLVHPSPEGCGNSRRPVSLIRRLERNDCAERSGEMQNAPRRLKSRGRIDLTQDHLQFRHKAPEGDIGSGAARTQTRLSQSAGLRFLNFRPHIGKVADVPRVGRLLVRRPIESQYTLRWRARWRHGPKSYVRNPKQGG